jgi:hypothetical protein
MWTKSSGADGDNVVDHRVEASPIRARVRRLEVLPDHRPAAGHYLLAGLDAVLPRLTARPVDALALADDLRTALARTAACGDTCRVRDATDAVRRAANLLQDGAVDIANQTLLEVRATLDRRPRRTS